MRPAITGAILLLGAAAATAQADPRARALAHWGSRGGPAGVDASAVREAREGFEELVEAAPDDFEMRVLLMEAIHFESRFLHPEGSSERRALVDRLIDEAEAALARLTPETPPTVRAKVEFWGSIAWGVWGYERGWIASARRSVATRVRDHAARTIELDPDVVDAGGLRILGRLHAVAPRVPLITGWIDHLRGVELLEQAAQRSRRDPRNLLFLAQALLEHVPARRCEAVSLLDELGRRAPAAEAYVEQDEVLRDARKLIEAVDRRGCP